MTQGRPMQIIETDPQTAALIAAEERRQREKIILIPSESLTPLAVRGALGSAFTSVYAEGYPRKAMMRQTPDELGDLDAQLASYRRYADRRFYKGAEFADIVESLAARRVAECFATSGYPAERIFANVQPLSGAAANLAVYDAFVEPGETVMGMALTEGGHLTHGSQFNVTGKRYRIVSYAVNPETGRLDYAQIRRLAIEHRPRMIIGGFTSYPWQPDWSEFRAIADEVGAILLADVAHTAGLIIGGVYPNPIGKAHVVTFTTHKTLCGGRGAVILSTDPAIASKIDTSIFPGQQGGPHVNKFAALAVALKTAQTPEFADLQQRIVANAAALSEALEAEGLTVAYGGTDTHLLLVDLRHLPSDTGFVMMGEVASRILDLVGIVCNKNTLPGDKSAADAHGVRFGTPWVTQRGMGPDEMRKLAKIIGSVLKAIRPFSYQGLRGELSRGKLPIDVLEQARRDVRALIESVDSTLAPQEGKQTLDESESTLWIPLRVRGGRSGALLNEAVPSELRGLAPNTVCTTYLADDQGLVISDLQVIPAGRDDYIVLAPRKHADRVESWLRGLAEGYTLFDPVDLFRKIQGPAVVERMVPGELPDAVREVLDSTASEDAGGQPLSEALARHPERLDRSKPYFVGQSLVDAGRSEDQREVFTWSEPSGSETRRTPLFEEHVARNAKMVPFAGWDMPVWYSSALDEHRAVRETAGLFDLGHMGVFQIDGEAATDFLNGVTSNYAGWLEDGQSQYAYLFDVDGNVIDDIMVYRRTRTRYLIVVNAANEAKDWEWLTGINDGKYLLDRERPGCHPGPRVALRDLKKERGVMDLALQGPKSLEILRQILASSEFRIVDSLERTEFAEIVTDGHQLLVARTGYTGELFGYEIYAASDDARWLWTRILEVGAPLGLLPCGLASRDSTRTEAGLPLYGHELAGPANINPYEAGFGSYVKLHKAFFVGRASCTSSSRTRRREIIRFEVEAGSRPVRDGALLIDRSGTVLGRVTSCVSLGDVQVGLALVERLGMDPGTPIWLRAAQHGPSAMGEIQVGDRVALTARGRILTRFAAQASPADAGGE